MAVSGDVTVTENGGQRSAKLHPYLITLVRWCISCLWGTASLFLHRLTAPLPAITASKQTKPPAKPRQAGTDHLHPDPKVECVVLHEPPSQPPTLDVIFVHGLYGSLCNTWRQGDWRSKYKLDPTKVPLRNHTTNTCACDNQMKYIYNDLNEIYTYETSLNENITFNNINEKLRKILPNENSLITEKFYNNTLEIVDNYDTQARFVEELFKNENKHCDNSCNSNKEIDGFRLKNDSKTVNGFKCNLDSVNSFKCNLDNANGGKCNLDSVNQCRCINGCNVGCGCVCDDCYSSCWPRDWIKEDFPGARVISINYTSDPYLWRPLWVKENKRLRLHERAEQMMQQLLTLDVGTRPIIWVGHSKGGLFIKQIYCEAYEAFLATKKHTNKEDIEISINNDSKDNNLNEMINDKYEVECESNILNNETVYSSVNLSNYNMNCAKNSTTSNNNDNISEIMTNIEISNNYRIHCAENCEINKDGNSNFNNKQMKGNDEVLLKDVNNDMIIRLSNDEPWISNETNDSALDNELNDSIESSEYKEDAQDLKTRSSLWTQSAGFMFYSVPHRGSPLADIKTPITARSIELLEIAKECPLVMELQDRWLAATGASRPQVRSLVETYRTLMSVLWLRIVSVDSADAGVGSLHGVSVDHREICKPASRDCLLYQELKELIQRSLKKCDC